MDLSEGSRLSSTTLILWKPIEAPSRWRGKAVWLEFPFLAGPARVFLNGAPVGLPDVAGGGSPEIPLTPAIRPGDSNLLVVEILGGQAALQMLYGDPPRIQTAASLHLDHLRARPAPEGGVLWVDAGLRQLPGAGTLQPPQALDTDEYSADFEIREGPEEANGALVPGGSLRSYRISKRQMNLTAPLPVEKYRPWTPEDPALYTVTTTLLRNGKPIDRMSITTGFTRWTIEKGRLRLDGKPVPVHSLTFPGGLIQLAEQGAWMEQVRETASLAETDSDMFLDLATRRRRGFWTQAIAPLRSQGFTVIRCGSGPVPPALLEAADRTGMLVEQRVEPRPREIDPVQGGGLASAYVVAEAVRRDQFHPSLAFWRVEGNGGARHLEALARAVTLLDAVHPVFGFLEGDRRIRRPGVLRRPGSEQTEAAIETANLPESTSLNRSWELYAQLTKPGERMPVSIGWAWAPVVGPVIPDALGLTVERVLLARANPSSGGCGVEIPEPGWAEGSQPLARGLPSLDVVLGTLLDPQTSSTLEAAFRRPHVLISPGVLSLRKGSPQSVEIALLLSPFEPHPPKAQVSLTLRPPATQPGAFPPSTSEHPIDVDRFAGDSDVVRAGIGLEINPEIPTGTAVLEAEVRWPGVVLRSGPQEVRIVEGP